MDPASRITTDPAKHGGKPCVRGLRIAVDDVLGYLASGMSEQEILQDFPDLEPDDIRACLAFAADGDRGALHASIEESYAQADRGELEDARAVLASLRSPRTQVAEAIAILEGAVSGSRNLGEQIRAFQECVWKRMSSEGSAEEVLRDLAYDLDFYEPDPGRRAEDASFHDEAAALDAIRDALERLGSAE